MGTTSARLGELLVHRRLIDSLQLADALRAQTVRGGRLGTNLVELGHLSVDTLTETLALQHAVPAATNRLLQDVSAQTLGSVPAALCGQHAVFPLAHTGQTLHLAMLDPQRLDLVDALAENLRLKAIRPHALAELRLLYLLETHYRVPRPLRYLRSREWPREDDRRIHLETVVAARRQTPNQTGPSYPALPPTSTQQPTYGRISAQTGASGPAAQTERAARRARGSGLHAAVKPIRGSLGFNGLESLHGGRSPLAAGPGATPADDLELDITVDATGDGQLAHMVRRISEGLDAANGRDAVIRRLLVPVLRGTSLTVLLLPRGDLAVGLAAWASETLAQPAQSLAVPLGSPSLLQQALSGNGVMRGDVRSEAPQQLIASHLGAPPPREACVAPISLDGAPVNLLCVQSTSSFPQEAVEVLKQLAWHAAAAFQRLSP